MNKFEHIILFGSEIELDPILTHVRDKINKKNHRILKFNLIQLVCSHLIFSYGFSTFLIIK